MFTSELTLGMTKKKKTNTREQRKMKWGEEGYERPGAERMKGREKTDNHSFAG